MSDEQRMLRELARNGWSERLEIPRETLVKYGLAEVFSEIASLRWDYHLSQDNGELSREYPPSTVTAVQFGNRQQGRRKSWRNGCSSRGQDGRDTLSSCGLTAGYDRKICSGGNRKTGGRWMTRNNGSLSGE